MSKWCYIGSERMVLVDASGRVLESFKRASAIRGYGAIDEKTGHEYVSDEAAKKALGHVTEILEKS